MDCRSIKRAFTEPQQSYFLFGPRGTGKSTMIKERHPSALYIDLLLSNVKQQYLANPHRLLDVIRAQPDNQIIIIDEIQKAPELLSLVHVLIEEKRGWHFILTGSSARKLKQKGVDLLGGRAIKKNLHPFMAYELGDEFNFEEALCYGLLPLRFNQADPTATLESYVALYIDEEIKAEGLVRRIEPFATFLENLSFSHGSIVNSSNIARECSLKRTTVDSWITIVEDLLIAYQIPVFKKRAKRILTSQKKLYFFDVGVYRALKPRSILDVASETDSLTLEGLVAQHLRAWIDYTKQKYELFFWRTKSGLEVDFIVFGEKGFWAIEVKNSQHINPKDLRGLKHFKEDYPEATTMLVYRGTEKMLIDGILCIPCSVFLKGIIPDNPLT